MPSLCRSASGPVVRASLRGIKDLDQERVFMPQRSLSYLLLCVRVSIFLKRLSRSPTRLEVLERAVPPAEPRAGRRASGGRPPVPTADRFAGLQVGYELTCITLYTCGMRAWHIIHMQRRPAPQSTSTRVSTDTAHRHTTASEL